MGMLSGAFAAGAADEYLKQGQETREQDFQEIRDRRLHELEKAKTKYSSDLEEGRAKNARDHSDKNYSFGYGESVVRDGEVVNTGGDRPTSGSSSKDGDLVVLNNGKKTTNEQLRKEYDTIVKANTDEFGNRIGDFNLEEWDEWRNKRVHPSFRINPQSAKEPEAEAEPSTWAWEEASKEYEKKASMWSKDTTQFGMSEEEWKRKRALELDAEKAPKKPGKPPVSLSEGEAAAKVKIPEKAASTPTGERPKVTLTKAATTSPEVMWQELRAAQENNPGISEDMIIQQIRAYFNLPAWDPEEEGLYNEN